MADETRLPPDGASELMDLLLAIAQACNETDRAKRRAKLIALGNSHAPIRLQVEKPFEPGKP